MGRGRFMYLWVLIWFIYLMSWQATNGQKFGGANGKKNGNNPIAKGKKRKGAIFLKCNNDPAGKYYISEEVYVTVQNISQYHYRPTQGFFYDHLGKKRSQPHLSVSSNMDYMCTYHLHDMLLTEWGVILTKTEDMTIAKDHPTVAGGQKPLYYHDPRILDGYYKGYVHYYKKEAKANITYDYVAAIRMRWDNTFGHFHIQTIPMIAAFYEFHRSEWDKVYWHTTLFGAGLLTLLGIPLERMILDRAIYAKQVIMPWYPNWNPLTVPAFKGITIHTCHLLTQALLWKPIAPTLLMQNKPVISILDPTLDNSYNAMKARGGDGNLRSLLQSSNRLVVYFSRSMQQSRRVINEAQLLNVLATALPIGYTLVVIQSVNHVKDIDNMHAMWQQFAQVVSKAKVLIGPHGSSLTNMIWAPPDCHFIEFNEFLDDKIYNRQDGREPARFMVFAGFWMRTNDEGNYWIIEPSKRHPEDFYDGNMYISIRELLQVFQQMKLLNTTKVSPTEYPEETHRFWKREETQGFPLGK